MMITAQISKILGQYSTKLPGLIIIPTDTKKIAANTFFSGVIKCSIRCDSTVSAKIVPITKAPNALLNPASSAVNTMPRHRPKDRMIKVSSFRYFFTLRSRVGIIRIPTMNHTTSVMASTPTFLINSTPSNWCLIAILDSKTIRTTATTSSIIRILVAPFTKRSLLKPASSTAFITIVVLDIQSIPAKNSEFSMSISAHCPTPNPSSIIPPMMVNAPIAATFPLAIRFLMRNSRPMQNSTNSTPILPHASTLWGSTSVFPNTYGPTSTPATM